MSSVNSRRNVWIGKCRKGLSGLFGILREHGLLAELSENGLSRLLNCFTNPRPSRSNVSGACTPLLRIPYGRVLTQATAQEATYP